MKYSLLKLCFKSAVRIGAGGLSKANNTLYADTIFSALSIEALQKDKKDFIRLLDLVKTNQLKFSDGLPFIGERYYVPKPMLRLDIDSKENKKKAAKKLQYIDVSKLSSYLEGRLDIEEENNFFDSQYGQFVISNKAKVPAIGEADPYIINVFRFCEISGLYICIGYEHEEDYQFIKELFTSLGWSGIGGKISSGYGRFSIQESESQALYSKLESNHQSKWMSISISLPTEEELAEIVPYAQYQLIKRSGFVASNTYASSLRKHKDIYMMGAGATFQKQFVGDIYDVSQKGGSHPVYRYAKPMFLGVR